VLGKSVPNDCSEKVVLVAVWVSGKSAPII